MDAGTVLAASQGTQLLMHAVRPPQYRNWRKWAIPMLANAIDAAAQAGARPILPGNVYNYCPVGGALVPDDLPTHPVTLTVTISRTLEGIPSLAMVILGVCLTGVTLWT